MDLLVVIVWYSSFLFLLFTGRLGKNIQKWVHGGFQHGSLVMVCFSVIDTVLLVMMYPIYIIVQVVSGDADKFIRVVSISLREVAGLSVLMYIEILIKAMFHR